MELNHTHDASRHSWLDSANAAGCDFPLQNLPLCIFRRLGRAEPWRGGVAIGDQIVDLAALHGRGCLQDLAAEATRAAAAPTLNALLDLGPSAWRALRHGIFALLEADSVHERPVRETLVPQAAAEFAVPIRIGDYTDFYTSLDHAVNVHAAVDCREWKPHVGIAGRAHLRHLAAQFIQIFREPEKSTSRPIRRGALGFRNGKRGFHHARLSETEQ